jgi:Sulfotransferase domain
LSEAARRLPDFFIVGQPKCGTTALHRMLSRHPQIFMPANKEPWFFATELQERTPPRPAGTPVTLEQYEALFEAAQPGQRAGEATVLYLWSRTAADAIAEVVPDARIVAILREPASLLSSLHLQFLESHVETETDLRRALELEPARREGRDVPAHTYWPQALAYSGHVRYVEQLRRYERHFGSERMLVLIYDDYRRDNQAAARSVLRFLEVDDSVPLQPAEVNPTVAPRSQGLHELVQAITVGRGPVSRTAKAALKLLLPRRVRRDGVRAAKDRFLYAPPKPPDERLVAELRARYRPEVVALSEYLGRDLVREWGYDELG